MVSKNFIDSPNYPGVAFAVADETKIVAAVGNWIRIYDFDI